jgi:hypothetical protein
MFNHTVERRYPGGESKDLEVNMTCWLYQMSVNSKNGESYEKYKEEVNEGDITSWEIRKVRPDGLKPKKGDTIVLFYSWSRGSRGGIYGWAEVMAYDEKQKTIDFVPKKPSNNLKYEPILDAKVKAVTKAIRNNFYMGTMWKIPPDKEIQIRQMLEKSG